MPRKKHQSWPIEIYWPRASFQELCKSCNFFFHFFSHIATVRTCNCNGNNISEINCQTGVRSNVLFEQERGWMEVVSIYWTVSQLLGQFLRAPSSQGLIYLVIYLCLCLSLQDKITPCKKRETRQHIAKRCEGEHMSITAGQRAASPSKVGIKAQSCFYPLHPPQVTTRRAQSSLACASSCVCT